MPVILRLPIRMEPAPHPQPEFIEVLRDDLWIDLDDIRHASGSNTSIGFQWCEWLALPDEDLIIWCDEDGKLKGLEPNEHTPLLFNRGTVAGTAIVTRYKVDEQGNPYGLTEGQQKRLAALFNIEEGATSTIT